MVYNSSIRRDKVLMPHEVLRLPFTIGGLSVRLTPQHERGGVV